MNRRPEPSGTDLIIDGNSLYAISWYAWQSSGSRGPKADSPLVTAFRSLIVMLDGSGRMPMPDRMLVCWDGKNRKNDKKRSPKPEGFKDYVKPLRKAMRELLGCPQHVAEVEGDDSVASAARASRRAGRAAIMATADKDIMQVLSEHIRCYDLRHKTCLGPADICEKWGIPKPRWLAIRLAIEGDPVDGIKGVPGYGKKRAAELLSRAPAGYRLSEAVEWVAWQLKKPDFVQAFYESLELTLLDTNLSVPEPKRIVLAHPDALDDHGLSSVSFDYVNLYAQQTGQDPDDVLCPR